MGNHNAQGEILNGSAQFYFVCASCTAKWFAVLPESVCQRCGSHYRSEEQFIPPWLCNSRSKALEADLSGDSLSTILLGMPAHNRGALILTVLRGLADESLLFKHSLLKTAFANYWRIVYGEIPRFDLIAKSLASPLSIKLVMGFNSVGYASTEDEMYAAVQSLSELLFANVAAFISPLQRTLFDNGACVAPRRRLPVTGGTAVDDLGQLIAEGRTFSTVYADPPWPYENEASRAAAVNHYPVMSLQSICDQPVRKLVNDNAHLHLWTTNGFLREAFEVIDAWGFEFKSCMVWIKQEMGMGNYWRVSHEFLLLGVRGQLTFQDRAQPSWIQAHRTLHSRKPGIVRAMVEKVSPGPYLELFGREELPNSAWTVFGNQIEKRAF